MVVETRSVVWGAMKRRPRKHLRERPQDATHDVVKKKTKGRRVETIEGTGKSLLSDCAGTGGRVGALQLKYNALRKSANSITSGGESRQRNGQ